MIFEFYGHDEYNNVCTTTSIDVTQIDKEQYSDNTIDMEIDAFKDRKIYYYQLNEDIEGLARSYDGSSPSGRYFHNS